MGKIIVPKCATPFVSTPNQTPEAEAMLRRHIEREVAGAELDAAPKWAVTESPKCDMSMADMERAVRHIDVMQIEFRLPAWMRKNRRTIAEGLYDAEQEFEASIARWQK